MTHEADNDNLAMSLMEEQYSNSDFSYSSAAHRVRRHPDQFNATAGKSEREVRMAHGKWSNQDKQEWSCGSCTYLNQPLFLSCEMCGQPRGEHAAVNAASDTIAESLANDTVTAQVVEEETQEIKQERIQEIMALQHGIYNRIREETEEPGIEELENSFAWMELEEEDNIADLPATTARVSCGSGKAGKKPSPMDASSSTVATAAMSSFSGSSRFGMDTSAGSQHSRLSRNSAIPDQALESLKGESSLNRASYAAAGRRRGLSHQTPNDFVDYNALKASIEGASVRSINLDGSYRSIPVAVQEDSNHNSVSSYGFGQDSNTSLGLLDEEIRPRTSNSSANRQASLAETFSSFDREPQLQQHHQADEPRSRGFRAGSRPTVVGRHLQDNRSNPRESQRREDPPALSSAGSDPRMLGGRTLSPIRPAARADSSSPTNRARRSLATRERTPPRMHHYIPQGTRSALLEEEPPMRADAAALRSLGDLPLMGEESPTRVQRTARAYRSHGDLPPPDESSPRDDSPGSHHSTGGGRKGFFTGLNATPKVHDEGNQDLGLGGSLHRQLPKAPVIPEEVKNSMASPRDSVFSRNLYAEKKQEAAAKNKRTSSGGKPVGIPILNRMLQRKKSPK